MQGYPHQPVLLQKTIQWLIADPDGLYVDGTAGSGGHSRAIAEKISPKGRLVCLDRDVEAVRLTQKRLSSLRKNIHVFKANYAELDDLLRDNGWKGADGILLDLGLSSYQLDHSGRGFSFAREEPLDMRMDLDERLTADRLINEAPVRELERIFRVYGEERNAGRIAKKIVMAREKERIDSSSKLAALIQSAMRPTSRAAARNPATKTFQALRIAVNQELEHLRVFLEKAPRLVNKGGRLVALSYHSLEDRMVKQAMVEWEKACTCPPDLPECVCGQTPLFRRLSKKGVRPDESEVKRNPRARSAMLRAAERI